MGRRLLGAFGAALPATLGGVPAAPTAASAAARGGSVTFSSPPPSLDGSPNADAHEYMQAISVIYDEAGMLSFKARLYDQPRWGANLPPVQFELGKSGCADAARRP
jgi:hypothetical protein